MHSAGKSYKERKTFRLKGRKAVPILAAANPGENLQVNMNLIPFGDIAI